MTPSDRLVVFVSGSATTGRGFADFATGRGFAGIAFGGGLASPRGNGSLGQRAGEIWNDQLRIKLNAIAQPVALRAGTVGTVETECAGLNFGETCTADRAGIESAKE